MISPQRRIEILDALRRGTVPRRGLGAFAVGLERFEGSLVEALDRVATGGSVFKAVRGEYGCGKTFFARWLQERAKERNFATAEVQISETETPLHRLETVYRRMIERLTTRSAENGAFRSIIESWFFALEEDVIAGGAVASGDADGLLRETTALMERRLETISRSAPTFAAALRGYREALSRGEPQIADGLLAWLAGEPNVSAAAKRAALLKGDVDHFGALAFLQGLLLLLRDSGHAGLVLVLDEVETLQRVRTDTRERGFNALRQLIDEIDAGRFPGLFLVITGTPAFFDGPQGVQRLLPLAQRLHTDFQTDARFDNPRAVQIRLPGFSHDSLMAVGRRVRDIFAEGAPQTARVQNLAADALLERLAAGVAGKLGGKVGVAPRLFLKKLVADVLDRIEQFADFDPTQHYALTLTQSELTDEERNAMPATSVDDIPLRL